MENEDLFLEDDDMLVDDDSILDSDFEDLGGVLDLSTYIPS